MLHELVSSLGELRLDLVSSNANRIIENELTGTCYCANRAFVQLSRENIDDSHVLDVVAPEQIKVLAL